VFNFLFFYHPKAVTLEDSPQGLAMRVGLSTTYLADVCDILKDLPLGDKEDLPEGFRMLSRASIRILFVTMDDCEIAFVQLKEVWMLWANSSKDNATVLTDTTHVDKYFNFAD